MPLTRNLIRKLILGATAGVVALVVLALLGAVGIHAFGAHKLEKARTTFDSRWGHLSLVPPANPISGEQNGALWLVSGGQTVSATQDDEKFYGRLLSRSAASWTTAERTRAQRILREQSRALQILLRIGSSSAFHLGSDGAHASHDELEFFAILRGVRLLALEASIATHQGREADALAALEALGNSAEGLLQTPSMLTLTIGSAATRWTTDAATSLVTDGCTTGENLVRLRNALPSEDPIHRGNHTLATLITKVADEGLHYTDDLHDPSLGWTIPFWVSNRYLVEDLVIAGALESWNRYLELGRIPAADWPPDTFHTTWEGTSWPPWIAMGGTWTPNLFSIWARAQAASSQLQLLDLAIELRLASPDGINRDSCLTVDLSTPTALTGGPIECSFDEDRGAIVLDLPRAEAALRRHLSETSSASVFPVIVIPVGSADDCG